MHSRVALEVHCGSSSMEHRKTAMKNAHYQTYHNVCPVSIMAENPPKANGLLGLADPSPGHVITLY